MSDGFIFVSLAMVIVLLWQEYKQYQFDKARVAEAERLLGKGNHSSERVAKHINLCVSLKIECWGKKPITIKRVQKIRQKG